MTFVGKILVILIMAFSLVFLGISTVTFVTAENWKDRNGKQAKKITEIQGQLQAANAGVEKAKNDLKAAQDDHAKSRSEQEARINDLLQQVARAQDTMREASAKLETAQKNAELSLSEANARKKTIDTLNETLAKAQAQANEFNAQNIELTDQKRILEREKATAEQNNRDLRNFNGRAIAYMRKMNIPLEALGRLDPNSVPPVVEGIVTELNNTRRTVEISIGSDEGIAVGQELYVYRLQPKPDFICRVKIVAVYPDKAVADVIGATQNGKRIQEKDIVSSTFLASR